MRGLQSSTLIPQCANARPVAPLRQWNSPECAMGATKSSTNIIKVPSSFKRLPGTQFWAALVYCEDNSHALPVAG